MLYTVTPTEIPDLLVLEPKVFGESGGFFFESFKQVTSVNVHFVQDNHSRSTQDYAPAFEHCIAWDDPAVGISWPQGLAPQLSAKDQADMSVAQAEVFA